MPKRPIDALYRQLEKLLEDMQLAAEPINKAIADLQKNCPHINTKYHPDVSGNYDNWTSCLDCDKELE